jgi:hemoglobin-like flavoprotein
MTVSAQATAYDAVNRSFGRCCKTNGFFDSFYSILKGSHPDIAIMFAETNFTRQNELLRVMLGTLLMFDHGGDAAKQVVAEVRKSHGRHRLNVRPELYDHWIDSLMQACAKHDPEFGEGLEDAWRKVLAKGISYIKSGYNEGSGEAECMSYLNWLDPDLETVARAWRRLPGSIRAELVARVKTAT